MDSTSSTSASRTCQLAEENIPHTSNYRGCRHAKEELRKRKLQRVSKTITGKMFSSDITTSGVLFAMALQRSTVHEQWSHPHQATVAVTAIMNHCVPTHLQQNQQWETGQQFRASSVNIFPQSSNCSTTDYNRVQWCCVRRSKNIPHYKSCFEFNEAKWPLDFIDPLRS
jgi:hypothetical protein